MNVVLTLPPATALEGSSPDSAQVVPSKLNTSLADLRNASNRRGDALLLFGEGLSNLLSVSKLKVASRATARHPGTVIMDTGIRVRSEQRRSSSVLQVKFDLARYAISLVSEGKTIDFDIKRSAPRAMMKLVRVEERLREENELGMRAKEALDTKALSGALHERMAPARQVSPAKLADGGYEFQIEAPAEMTRHDGSQLQITGTVTIQTDHQGRPVRFMSAVSTEDRVLAGSKSCSGPHMTHISERGVRDVLREKLRSMFPKEYESMGTH